MVADRPLSPSGLHDTPGTLVIFGGTARISRTGVENLAKAAIRLAAQVEGLAAVPDLPPSIAVSQLTPAALAVRHECIRAGLLLAREGEVQ